MQKTLGGDRLGAGKKMKVELKNYERSTHDLGYLWRSTMSAGTLVPFMSEVALPGDTFDIKLNAVVMTHPTLGPLFGSYKVQLDVFQAPFRLYHSFLHNNKLGIGLTMSQVALPNLELRVQATPAGTTDIDNSQVNPSCLLSYLGIRGGGLIDPASGVSQMRSFNAIPFLAYWEIYKNYYANKQEEYGAVIHTDIVANVTTVTTITTNGNTIPFLPSTGPVTFYPDQPLLINYSGAEPIPSQIILQTAEYGDLTAQQVVIGYHSDGSTLTSVSGSTYGTITINSWRYATIGDMSNTPPIVKMFQLSQIDLMRQQILGLATNITLTDSTTLQPYTWVLGQIGGPVTDTTPYRLASQEGLAIKTYQSDLFNNWLQSSWIDGSSGINEITAIDTTTGSFQINTLILARKVYDMLNRIAVSGGSYDDWLDAVYAHERYTRCESPIYHGGLSKELVFQEVISNAQSGIQPLGTLAGRGQMSQKHKGGNITIKVDEPSYIIGIVSLTPRIDYSQGNKWDTHLITMDDLHKPALDEIGFQDLITEQMAWWDTSYDVVNNKWVQVSAGKQPAWINYMTNVNQTRGNFAILQNEMFMTLNRRYEKKPTLTTGVSSILDLTTYIDPSKYNFIFAQTALDAQNFWTQIAVDITARRKMSAKVMPNL